MSARIVAAMAAALLLCGCAGGEPGAADEDRELNRAAAATDINASTNVMDEVE